MQAKKSNSKKYLYSNTNSSLINFNDFEIVSSRISRRNIPHKTLVVPKNLRR